MHISNQLHDSFYHSVEYSTLNNYILFTALYRFLPKYACFFEISLIIIDFT